MDDRWDRCATPAQAVWITRSIVAVPAWRVPDDATGARLHWSRPAGLVIAGHDITGGDPADQAGLTPLGAAGDDLIARWRWLRGWLAYRLDDATAARAEEIVRGQVAFSLAGSYATAVQVTLVLDDLYASAAVRDGRPLGAGVDRDGVTLRLWAPTAQQVDALVWPVDGPAGQRLDAATIHPLTRQPDGCWELRLGPGHVGAEYLYRTTVFAPHTDRVETNLVTDPYSLALTLNSTRSVIVDPDDETCRPANWHTDRAPGLERWVDSTIYELHIRDFSISDETVPGAHRGSYLAFSDEGHGAGHLRSLAEAGLTTVHLLPCFDFASVDEDRTRWPATPDLTGLPPDSAVQQQVVSTIADRDGFNWGYDPYHWLVPEGSYASSNATAHGAARLREFRTMVTALHAMGLRVVMDQVYNHTYAGGQHPNSVLDKIVPGYYHRRDGDGNIYTSAAGADVATEHAMAGRLMIDACVSWARRHHVDGFRFDLMGFHSRDLLLAVRAALDELTPERDGVDGRQVHLYGEGWNFGEVADDALFDQARQGNLAGTGIATFSDRIRDALRGGGVSDGDPRRQGVGTGLGLEDNGAGINGDAGWRLGGDTDIVTLGLAGNLVDYRFRSAAGHLLTGREVRYGPGPAGYASAPDEIVNYVDAHDNETLWDALTVKLPPGLRIADRIRMNVLNLAFVTLAQGVCFWHAGADLLRSKSLDRNSYNSGDWFNRLDWTGTDNGSGRGLPPWRDNAGSWPYLRPFLAGAERPTADQVRQAAAMAADLLRLRRSSRLFRLGDAGLIQDKVTFPVAGTLYARSGVIVMHLDDRVGPSVDEDLAGLVVAFNTTPWHQVQPLPLLQGEGLRLSRVQRDGADPVVRSSTWEPAEGRLSVPPRTVAVWEHPR